MLLDESDVLLLDELPESEETVLLAVSLDPLAAAIEPARFQMHDLPYSYPQPLPLSVALAPHCDADLATEPLMSTIGYEFVEVLDAVSFELDPEPLNLQLL